MNSKTGLLQNRILAARLKARYGTLRQMLEETKRDEFELLPNERVRLREAATKANSNVRVEGAPAPAPGPATTVATAEAAKAEKPVQASGEKKSRMVVVKKKIVEDEAVTEQAVAAALRLCVKILGEKKKVQLGFLGGKMDQGGVNMEPIRAKFGSFKGFVLSRAELLLTDGKVMLAADYDEEEVRGKSCCVSCPRLILFFFFPCSSLQRRCSRRLRLRAGP